MTNQELPETWRRWRGMQTHVVRSLPIAILMPHSGCNCRCLMCDIWKGNGRKQQLTEKDIHELLAAFRKLNTRQVLLSGGEALLHPQFFQFCALLKAQGLYLTLLSTGITIARHAEALVDAVDDIIISLDGDPAAHDRIRNITGAYEKLFAGIKALRLASPGFPVSGRTVIHRGNFRQWSDIVDTARHLELDSISFLPADTTSAAFNREEPWTTERQSDLQVPESEWPELELAWRNLCTAHAASIQSGFIRESKSKLHDIVTYYKAQAGAATFPARRCNAPWVSAVVEADGAVRPCFFLPAQGNIRDNSLDEIVNSKSSRDFRKELRKCPPDTCTRCVCSLYLPPNQNPLPRHA
jgi:MoaA/NifB/PqqE/SkfB family radical SAM enzyme